ncbi:hypothetical protein D0809_09025 [Flavobacterium circumlabens]|uniref:Uncharacterized protein n=1 Tax=Flavobacterium circumlabens TaxID=2133765 RepID=A0A4Y7UG11_9FLAO|nr:hypothetical protein [Flavobacterium circumlabens]TCN60064.1 hypothetical protein EV142_102684 [Flavobacterium circumlabens]TEB45296.1 hypothetical protein D0809_09025 [Flavobacterium circumlabens]
MNVKIKFFFLVLLLTLLQSCQLENTPEEYFDRTALNTNILMEFGARDFRTMEQNRNAGQLLAYDDKGTFPAKSYEDHILRFKMPYLDQSIEKIKELKPTDETTPMIQASLDLFEFVKEKYKTDYLTIARLMEKKAPREEIDKALAEMEQTSFPVFDKKYKKLWDLAMPYAKKHGIEVKTY